MSKSLKTTYTYSFECDHCSRKLETEDRQPEGWMETTRLVDVHGLMRIYRYEIEPATSVRGPKAAADIEVVLCPECADSLVAWWGLG